MAKQILGRVSIIFKGEYNSTTNYEKLDIVSYNGSSYACLKGCVGVIPTDTTYWQLVAQKGEQGEQGIQGVRGVQGATPNIQIGTVETLNPTEQATVTQTGTLENPIFNFGIPKGVQGQNGQDGYTPIKGTDYFTEEDIKSLNIPTKTSELDNDVGFITDIDVIDIRDIGININFQDKKYVFSSSNDKIKVFQTVLEKTVSAVSKNQMYSFALYMKNSGDNDKFIKFNYSSKSLDTPYWSFTFIGETILYGNGGLSQTRVPRIEIAYQENNGVYTLQRVNFYHTLVLLSPNNGYSYNVTDDYNPAHKKYVDDAISAQVGNINTILETLTTVSEVSK